MTRGEMALDFSGLSRGALWIGTGAKRYGRLMVVVWDPETAGTDTRGRQLVTIRHEGAGFIADRLVNPSVRQDGYPWSTLGEGHRTTNRLVSTIGNEFAPIPWSWLKWAQRMGRAEEIRAWEGGAERSATRRGLAHSVRAEIDSKVRTALMERVGRYSEAKEMGLSQADAWDFAVRPWPTDVQAVVDWYDQMYTTALVYDRYLSTPNAARIEKVREAANALRRAACLAFGSRCGVCRGEGEIEMGFDLPDIPCNACSTTGKILPKSFRG